MLEIDNRVLTVVVSGAADRADLRRAAELVEDALLAQPQISLVRVANEPDARERTLSEYRGLLDEAGFDIVDVIRFEAPRDLLVTRKRKTHN